MVKAISIKGREMEYIRFGKEGAEAFVILPGLLLFLWLSMAAKDIFMKDAATGYMTRLQTIFKG